MKGKDRPKKTAVEIAREYATDSSNDEIWVVKDKPKSEAKHIQLRQMKRKD